MSSAGNSTSSGSRPHLSVISVVGAILIALISPFNIFSATFTHIDIAQQPPLELPDSIELGSPITVSDPEVVIDSINAQGEYPELVTSDTLAVYNANEASMREFNPDPTRAVWLSALCPGLGQIYNRRFWKLPIVVGAFMGLGYGTSWNNGMLRDYTRAYNDITDNDPSTKSYMDFFPSTTREEDLNKTWLTKTLKNKKDYFRRNRDLCIICMVGVYLVAMVDAYVDASLAHFDISEDLSMRVAPALIPDARNQLPGVGVQWAFNF